MSERKPPPRKSVVDDVQGDLRAVGGFFKKIWQATERVDRGVEAAKEEPPPPGSSAAKRIASQREAKMQRAAEKVIDVRNEECGVCGGTPPLGSPIKGGCPACTEKKR
jgi:hypothetical protein